MPVIIDGTNGISGVDGSASTPAVQGTDTNTGMFFPAADTIAFAEGGTEVMRIDSSGNVRVGSSSTALNSINSTNTFGFKNRIINGAMVIDQRNAGSSVGTASGFTLYSLDRWQIVYTQTSKITVQQNAGSVTPPAGFRNYLGVTSSSAYSVLAGDTFVINHLIEGFNVADLAFGTASASTVTLSFWVRSSLTGTFGGAIMNDGVNRSYTFSYSIPLANTWTQISVTIPGDTTGTWLTNNGIGMYVRFGLGSGSTYTQSANSWGTGNAVQPPSTVSVVGTNGATFYITGVQLEKGSTATSFDYRPYGTELQLCQRYYEKSFDDNVAPSNGSATALSTNNGATALMAINNTTFSAYVPFKVTKRIAGGTLTTFGNSSGHWGYAANNGAFTWNASSISITSAGANSFNCTQQVVNNVFILIVGHWTYSAEL